MNVRDLFEKYVLKTPGNGNCWIWQGNIGNQGYGRISLLGNLFLTHRFAYEIYLGLIPDDKGVLHKCNNRLCVNPEHLYLGTPQDNSRDWIEARKKDIQNTINACASPLKSFQQVEKELIRNTLAINNQSRNKTAEILGISTTTLWRKIKKYSL